MNLSGILLQMSPPPVEAPQHSVLHLIFSSDPVVKVALLILVFFSVTSWAIIFFKYSQVKKAKKSSEKFLDTFEKSGSIEEVLTKSTPTEGNPLYQIFSYGISDILKLRQLKSKDPGTRANLNLEHIRKNIRRAESDEMSRLEQFTSFLATTASACPFIGLFGTVWGILTAFWQIGQQKSSSLAVVGPYIAEALVATAIGLAAAIPAVIAYNYFVSRLKILGKDLNDFAIDLEHQIQREYF
jgi:biopolymer transport protein TolQ